MTPAEFDQKLATLQNQREAAIKRGKELYYGAYNHLPEYDFIDMFEHLLERVKALEDGKQDKPKQRVPYWPDRPNLVPL